jgi:hypothetical protein
MRNLDPILLRQLLRYDPETGKLFWRERTAIMFAARCRSAEHNAASWNAQNAGKEAFKATGADGYYRGGVLKRQHLAHRVIWALVHGEWPADQIDHINGNRTDNRLKNLRAVSRIENMRNVKCHADSTSGACGVSWEKRRLNWAVRIWDGKRAHFLGSFDTFDDAVAARKKAEVLLGYHENHGRTSA